MLTYKGCHKKLYKFKPQVTTKVADTDLYRCQSIYGKRLLESEALYWFSMLLYRHLIYFLKMTCFISVFANMQKN